MSYVICEYDKLKTSDWFIKAARDLEANAIRDTEAVWHPLKMGYYALERTDQFGRTTILPENFADEAGDVLDLNHTVRWWGVDNYRQYYTSTSPSAVVIPGWKTLLQGGGAPIGVTPEDIRLAWIGLAFPVKTLLISKIQFEIGDKRFPKIDIEELHNYNKPALIFEEGFIIPEETHFRLYGFFEDPGYQRVIPLGFQMYRRRDLVISRT